MAKMGGGGGGGGGPEFDLSDEILAVMPTDPYDQLDLARKITSMAIASRVSKLEAEVGRLRQRLQEKDRTVTELEETVSRVQRACQEAESRLKIALDENTKLSAERDSLTMTVKRLGRDLGKLIKKGITEHMCKSLVTHVGTLHPKGFYICLHDCLSSFLPPVLPLLETFKRQLMLSLNDDNSSLAETVDIGTCDQSVPRSYSEKDEGPNGYVNQISFRGSTDVSSTIDEAARHTTHRFSITPYITPRLTPTGTPKIISTSVSPRGYSAAGSPQKTSGMTSPTKPHYDGRTALSTWYPPSQQSSAASSPPRARSMPARAPRIDGKEFFRQARSRLSYEQFSAFLANIKELNAQKQTREETLTKAEEIFGIDNKDLYLSFQGLLSRSIH